MVFKTATDDFRVLVYSHQGYAGEGTGHHVMAMPAYDTSVEELEMMVDGVGEAVERVLEKPGI